jgi:hypothetical protein
MAESPKEDIMKKLLPVFVLTVACQDFETPTAQTSTNGQTLSEVLAGPTLDAVSINKNALKKLTEEMSTFQGDVALGHYEAPYSVEVFNDSLPEVQVPSDLIIDADLPSWLDLANVAVNHSTDESIANMLDGLDAQVKESCVVNGITLGVVVDEKIVANQHVPQLHVQIGEIVPQHISMENPYTNTEISASEIDRDEQITWYEGTSHDELGEQVWIGATLANADGAGIIVGAHLSCE